MEPYAIPLPSGVKLKSTINVFGLWGEAKVLGENMEHANLPAES